MLKINIGTAFGIDVHARPHRAFCSSISNSTIVPSRSSSILIKIIRTNADLFVYFSDTTENIGRTAITIKKPIGITIVRGDITSLSIIWSGFPLFSVNTMHNTTFHTTSITTKSVSHSHTI